MRLRVTQSFAEGWTAYTPGMEIEAPDARGVELMRLGVAVRIPDATEVATLPDRGEKAVKVRPVR